MPTAAELKKLAEQKNQEEVTEKLPEPEANQTQKIEENSEVKEQEQVKQEVEPEQKQDEKQEEKVQVQAVEVKTPQKAQPQAKLTNKVELKPEIRVSKSTRKFKLHNSPQQGGLHIVSEALTLELNEEFEVDSNHTSLLNYILQTPEYFTEL